MAKNLKKTFDLKGKVEVIFYHEKNPKTSSRILAEKFGVGTQIQSILTRKAELKKDFEDNQPSERKRKLRFTDNDEINKLTWEWFKDVVARRLPVTGPMVQRCSCKTSASNWTDGSKM